jgi:hypothetical protein
MMTVDTILNSGRKAESSQKAKFSVPRKLRTTPHTRLIPFAWRSVKRNIPARAIHCPIDPRYQSFFVHSSQSGSLEKGQRVDPGSDHLGRNINLATMWNRHDKNSAFQTRN